METLFGMLIFLPAFLTIAGVCIFFGQCVQGLRKDKADEALIQETRERIAKARSIVARSMDR